MAVLKAVMDGIETISGFIGNIGRIVDTVRTGQGHLQQRYRDAIDGVRGILEEINKTLLTTTSATSVVTHFGFAAHPASPVADLRVFSSRIAACKSRIATLRQTIDLYRGRCSKIKQHVENIKRSSKVDYLFRVLGVSSTEENVTLSRKLQEVYDEKLNHYIAVNALCENLQRALDHVHQTLGAPALLQPGKVPVAAALLAEYGRAFMRVESQANQRAAQIRELIVAMS